jgi:hypothetical protein
MWLENGTALKCGGLTTRVQLPRARRIRRHQKTSDLAREAVGWNPVLGGVPL